ncbi:hypothetical protein Pelo_4192 [Pelomyxa schiedti]|nr:hypothetical protein Pelo_4192 [Pelomyxa schiedti]
MCMKLQSTVVCLHVFVDKQTSYRSWVTPFLAPQILTAKSWKSGTVASAEEGGYLCCWGKPLRTVGLLPSSSEWVAAPGIIICKQQQTNTTALYLMDVRAVDIALATVTVPSDLSLGHFATF